MNPLPVPYFKQDTVYSCGPAAMQMILKYFGMTKSEKDLEEELETTTENGTSHSMILKVFNKHGLYCYANDGSNMKEISYFLSQKIPLLVNYIEHEEKEGHYAVAVACDENMLVLNDPMHGEGFRIDSKEFEDSWVSGDGKFERWICAVSNEPFIMGKTYNPQKI